MLPGIDEARKANAQLDKLTVQTTRIAGQLATLTDELARLTALLTDALNRLTGTVGILIEKGLAEDEPAPVTINGDPADTGA